LRRVALAPGNDGRLAVLRIVMAATSLHAAGVKAFNLGQAKVETKGPGGNFGRGDLH
jgi:hypothetical protein